MHKLDFFIFNYMCVGLYTSVVPTEARDNMGTLGSTITVYGELNSGLLQEQYVLLTTEQSLIASDLDF